MRNAPQRICSSRAAHPAYPLSGGGARRRLFRAVSDEGAGAVRERATPPGFPTFPASTFRSATAEWVKAPLTADPQAVPPTASPGWFRENSTAVETTL